MVGAGGFWWVLVGCGVKVVEGGWWWVGCGWCWVLGGGGWWWFPDPPPHPPILPAVANLRPKILKKNDVPSGDLGRSPRDPSPFAPPPKKKHHPTTLFNIYGHLQPNVITQKIAKHVFGTETQHKQLIPGDSCLNQESLIYPAKTSCFRDTKEHKTTDFLIVFPNTCCMLYMNQSTRFTGRGYSAGIHSSEGFW